MNFIINFATLKHSSKKDDNVNRPGKISFPFCIKYKILCLQNANLKGVKEVIYARDFTKRHTVENITQ